ncbi:spry domain containing socs box protein [Anaeramoeba flamelloides]|uniref:Spry domain containing socs box protein n=1 Tax=Anaeramoeba flamelloides TaxID=1746091 RepID=A0ABQ8Z3P1_9EUKA|nr:spry domain containing socs box protein [Anaeramoeba flamelloides]
MYFVRERKSNKTFTLNINSPYQVKDLESAVSDRIGIHTDYLLLKYTTTFLDSNKLLSDYKIAENSKIDLIIRTPYSYFKYVVFVKWNETQEEWRNFSQSTNEETQKDLTYSPKVAFMLGIDKSQDYDKLFFGKIIDFVACLVKDGLDLKIISCQDGSILDLCSINFIKQKLEPLQISKTTSSLENFTYDPQTLILYWQPKIKLQESKKYQFLFQPKKRSYKHHDFSITISTQKNVFQETINDLNLTNVFSGLDLTNLDNSNLFSSQNSQLFENFGVNETYQQLLFNKLRKNQKVTVLNSADDIWSSEFTGSGMEISENWKTVTSKYGGSKPGSATARSETIISKGQIYKFTVKVEENGSSLAVGICEKNAPLDYPSRIGYLYEQMARKSKPNTKPEDYGLPYSKGDKIDIIVDLRLMKLSFELNDQTLGVAFTDLPDKEYVLLVTFYSSKMTLL